MNLPPFLKTALKSAKTVEELKAVLVAIFNEYDFGILAEYERRIEELEKEEK